MDGAAGYALSDDALELLREGDVRIFSRQRAVEADGLVMVVFSIPESERDKRHQLRSTLVSMGFGTVSPGVWVAPGLLHDEVARTLDHQGLAPFVDLFRARLRRVRLTAGSGGGVVGPAGDREGVRRVPREVRRRACALEVVRCRLPHGLRDLCRDAHRLASASLPRPGPSARAAAARLERRQGGGPLRRPRCVVAQPGPRVRPDDDPRGDASLQNGDALDLDESLDVPQVGTPRCRPSPGSPCRPGAATRHRSRVRGRGSRPCRRCRWSRSPGRFRNPQRPRARQEGSRAPARTG